MAGRLGVGGPPSFLRKRLGSVARIRPAPWLLETPFLTDRQLAAAGLNTKSSGQIELRYRQSGKKLQSSSQDIHIDGTPERGHHP
jgi:hypothetical protein